MAEWLSPGGARDAGAKPDAKIPSLTFVDFLVAWPQLETLGLKLDALGAAPRDSQKARGVKGKNRPIRSKDHRTVIEKSSKELRRIPLAPRLQHACNTLAGPSCWERGVALSSTLDPVVVAPGCAQDGPGSTCGALSAHFWR